MKNSLTCTLCGASVNTVIRNCQKCENDVGFPNVRRANKPSERQALASRVLAKRREVQSVGLEREMRDLFRLARQSRPVLNRHLGTLYSWMKYGSPLFPPFYAQIRRGRDPEENVWDEQRATVENCVNPNYYDNLIFAALSPDGRGMSYYGPYVITLNETYIRHRASLFEENPFYFCDRHQVIAGKEPPQGYRGSWSQKGTLAVAKLGTELARQNHNRLEDLLLGQNGHEPNCDFIEVHIFGPLHRDIISHVKGPKPTNRSDIILWDEIGDTLRARGVTVEEVI